MAALLLDAPLEYDVHPIEEEVASLNGILSDLGCSDSFDSPVSQPLASLVSDIQTGIGGIPLFRLGGATRTQWIRRVSDSTRLLAYTVASFQGDRMSWNSELCHLCLGRRHDASGCDLLTAVTRQRRQLTGICGYPHCKSTGDHSTYFCRHLNARCPVCRFRGLLTTDRVCDSVIPNFELFQEWHSDGYLTQNSEDIRDTSWGYFPVSTVTENRLLEA